MEAEAFAIPRALKRERIGDRAARIASPWTVAAIVAAFYMVLTIPGLAWNPYQFVNIGQQYYEKGTSSTIIKEHARPLHGSDRSASDALAVAGNDRGNSRPGRQLASCLALLDR